MNGAVDDMLANPFMSTAEFGNKIKLKSRLLSFSLSCIGYQHVFYVCFYNLLVLS